MSGSPGLMQPVSPLFYFLWPPSFGCWSIYQRHDRKGVRWRNCKNGCKPPNGLLPTASIGCLTHCTNDRWTQTCQPNLTHSLLSVLQFSRLSTRPTLVAPPDQVHFHQVRPMIEDDGTYLNYRFFTTWRKAVGGHHPLRISRYTSRSPANQVLICWQTLSLEDDNHDSKRRLRLPSYRSCQALIRMHEQCLAIWMRRVISRTHLDSDNPTKRPSFFCMVPDFPLENSTTNDWQKLRVHKYASQYK